MLLNGIGVYVFVPALAAVITVDVFLRYVFLAPLVGGNEIAGVLLLAVFVGAIPLCALRARHIEMDLLYLVLPRRWQRGCDALGALCGAVFGALLLYQCVTKVPEMIRYHETTYFLEIPFWPFVAYSGVAATLLTAYYLIRLGQAARAAFAGGGA